MTADASASTLSIGKSRVHASVRNIERNFSARHPSMILRRIERQRKASSLGVIASNIGTGRCREGDLIAYDPTEGARVASQQAHGTLHYPVEHGLNRSQNV